jgi:hypothetical protein
MAEQKPIQLDNSVYPDTKTNIRATLILIASKKAAVLKCILKFNRTA